MDESRINENCITIKCFYESGNEKIRRVDDINRYNQEYIVRRVINMSPFFSICVPTYNQSEKVYKLVKSILLFEGEEIEVVVLDNCSKDGTYERLLTINDSRLHVYQNSIPLAGQDNWIEVLKYAKGKFAFHLNDRDYLNISALNKVITFLKNNNLAAVWEKNGSNCHDKYFSAGFQAKKNIPYQGYHPTGLILNLELINENIDLCNYQKLTYLKFMPHICLLYDLLSYADFAILYDGVWAYASIDCLRKNKSGVVNSYIRKKHAMYYEPDVIYRDYLYMVRVIGQDVHLSELEKKEIIKFTFPNIIKACTVTYSCFKLSEVNAAHYGIMIEPLVPLEMEKYTLELVRKFYNDLENVLPNCRKGYRTFALKTVIISYIRILKFKFIGMKKLR